ncbi:MAG: type II secretion system secretin GspD [Pseudomonadota bacterium]
MKKSTGSILHFAHVSLSQPFSQRPFALHQLAAAVLLCCVAVAPASAKPVGAKPAGAPAPAAAPAAAAAPVAKSQPEEAALNFVGADIEAVIKAVGHYTGMTFIIDPRVKGTLTLVSEKALSKAQAFSLLTSSLRLQGYTVVVGDGYAKVVPEAEAKLQSSPTKVGSAGPGVHGDQIATQIYHLDYESAVNLTAVLRPLISPNNSITADAGNNSLVITDYADNLARLSKIIAALDAPVGADIDIVPVRYAIASDLASIINKLMEPSAGGDSGRVSVVVDPRTNALIVRAPSAARAAQAKALIAKMDMPTAQAGNVHVVYLKNADAVKLAQTLRAVVSSDASANTQQASGTSGGSVPSGGGTAQGGDKGGGQTQGGQTQGGNNLNQQNAQLGGGGSAGFIQADASTNTLIITASEPVYRNLRSVIDQLDVRRAQVYIEALVVEVNSDKAAEFGVQWLGASGDGSSNYRAAGLQSFSLGGSSNNLLALGTGKGAVVPGAGFTVGLFRQISGQLGLGAIAHALEAQGHANILSTPNMLTLDNELSIIKVGQNVPIISGQFTTPASGTSSNPFQTIDRRDVGLTLKVRPQISEGGTIKMAIYHESSSVDPASLKDAAGVTTNIRVIENNVIADDGQIIVLGGLIKDEEGGRAEKVPGLGSLPLVGNLFTYQTRARTKTNLMVFLRPVVVRSKEQSGALAIDRYDYMRSAGQAALPPETAVMPDLGAPVLPQLTEGQPPAGGAFAPATRKGTPSAPPVKD